MLSYNFRHPIWFLVLLLCSQFCMCKFLLKDMKQNRTYNLKTFSALPWDISSEMEILFPSEESMIPIVPIDSPFGDFNPCDVSSYRFKAVRPLIEATYTGVGINHSMISTLGWIAYYDMNLMIKQCTNEYNNGYAVDLAYPTLAVRLIQQLGASAGLALYSDTPGFEKVVVPPGVNVNDQTIYGIKINLPLVMISKTHKEFDDFGLVIASSQWLLLSPSIVDPNPFDVVFNPFGFYRIAWLILGVISLCISVFSFWYMSSVRKYYSGRIDVASRMALRMRFMILVPEILGGILRALASIDPVGITYIYNYFVARMLMSLSGALNTFTDLVTVFYCWDVYNVYKGSRNMEASTPFLVRYKLGGTLILVLAGFMVVAEQVVLYLGMTLVLGGETLFLPVFYTLISNLITSSILSVITLKMGKEVKLVMVTLNKMFTPLSSTPTVSESRKSKKSRKSNKTSSSAKVDPSSGIPVRSRATNDTDEKTKSLIAKTKSFLTMRRYIQLAVVGRMTSVGACVLLGSRWVERGPFNYAFSLLLLAGSYTFSSLAQVFAALQLPHSKTVNIVKPATK